MTQAILLDIEGTTTPIDFVHRTLFPFAKQHISQFVVENFDTLTAEIAQLSLEHSTDSSYTLPLKSDDPDSASEYLKHLIDSDRKSTPLKSIQGKIWQAGYESGELRSVVFEDVPKAFERWTAQGKTIAIFSSGSVLAQKLIFRYSDHGDLSQYISAYFDTTTGPKREAESYRKIVAKLGSSPNEMLFVSDILEELEAAKEAGLGTVLSIRNGNTPLQRSTDIGSVTDFSQI